MPPDVEFATHLWYLARLFFLAAAHLPLRLDSDRFLSAIASRKRCLCRFEGPAREKFSKLRLKEAVSLAGTTARRRGVLPPGERHETLEMS